MPPALSPPPDDLLPEATLLGSGLLVPPGREHVVAALGLLEDLRRRILATLEAADPGSLFANPRKPSYFDKLTAEPDYAKYGSFLMGPLGPEGTAEYQVLHQSARATLLDRYPKSSIDTVMGPVALDPDPESLAQWLHEVDIVETADRIGKDLAATALTLESVEVFAAVFPKIYAWLESEIRLYLAVKAAKGWTPEFWLEDALRIFLRLPFDGTVEIKPEPLPPTPAPTRKGGWKPESLATNAMESDAPLK